MAAAQLHERCVASEIAAELQVYPGVGSLLRGRLRLQCRHAGDGGDTLSDPVGIGAIFSPRPSGDHQRRAWRCLGVRGTGPSPDYAGQASVPDER
jgi:hypothetical protein